MNKALLLILMLITSSVSAQRYDLLSGKFENLKDITEYNVVFDYSDIKIHGYDTEEAYLADKMRLREHVEGKAEKFRAEWFSNRTQFYEPAFISYINSHTEDKVKVGQNPEAKYTMVVHSTWVYPGYNMGTSIKPAKLSATITVRETANPENILITVAFDKSIGLQHEVGGIFLDKRIAWAYEKIAKNFTIQLKRFL